MVQGTHAHHPTADDHNASMLSHIRIPRLGDPAAAPPQTLRSHTLTPPAPNLIQAKSRRQPIRKGREKKPSFFRRPARPGPTPWASRRRILFCCETRWFVELSLSNGTTVGLKLVEVCLPVNRSKPLSHSRASVRLVRVDVLRCSS